MPVLSVTLQGRFGNQCMQWLFCRALAERYNYELHCEPWIGEQVFDITSQRYCGTVLPRVNELEIFDQMERGISLEFRGYAQTTERLVYGTRQTQRAMPYTKRQAQEWLRIRPVLRSVLWRINVNRTPIIADSIVAHQRAGDYIGYGYPVVSRQSYQDAAVKYFGSCAHVTFVSEEQPTAHAPLPDELAFLPDFFRLMNAPTLLRANSTFSFLAGLLSIGLVLSPRIDGLEGGHFHDDVQFEAGNHCRLASFDFCSDLLVSP
jgi:hypothetical protein